MGTGRSGMARYVVDAVVLEGRSAREVAQGARDLKELDLRADRPLPGRGLPSTLEPRSKRPRSCKHGTPPESMEAIVELREQLHTEGHDCGAATIAYHLAGRIEDVPSRATIWRILKREGLIVSEPQKRPRSSLIRFQAELPNETWQTDVTHWHLAGGEHAEIMNVIDDHSRLFLVSQAFPTIKAQDVVDTFHKAVELHGLPASLLTDNGAGVHSHTTQGQGALTNRSSSGSALPARTRGHTTPKPAARSSVYTKHSSALPHPPKRRRNARRTAIPARHVRPLLQQHSPPQSPRRTHTTTGIQRPHQGQTRPPERSQQPTSASAKTRSTPRRQSDPAPQQPTPPHRHRQSPHRTARSSSSSPTETSASSTQTPANSSANSPSTPPATTNQSTTPELSTISRDTRPGCPETSQNGRGGIRTPVRGLTPETVFETAAFNHSATLPKRPAQG